MRIASLLVVALAAFTSPAVALAEKPAQAGKNHGKGHATAKHRGDARRVGVASAPCPPGLAKKSPACVPPGQARQGLVGRAVDWDRVHVVRKPGLYGLADAPDGQRYAIIDGRLVRIDSRTAKVLSVIRAVDTILD